MAPHSRLSLSLLYDEFRSHLESGRTGEALDVMTVAGFTAQKIGLGKAESTLTCRFPFGILDSPEPVSEEYLQELRDESRADELAGKLMLRFLVDSIQPLADSPYDQHGASHIRWKAWILGFFSVELYSVYMREAPETFSKFEDALEAANSCLESLDNRSLCKHFGAELTAATQALLATHTFVEPFPYTVRHFSPFNDDVELDLYDIDWSGLDLDDFDGGGIDLSQIDVEDPERPNSDFEPIPEIEYLVAQPRPASGYKEFDPVLDDEFFQEFAGCLEMRRWRRALDLMILSVEMIRNLRWQVPSEEEDIWKPTAERLMNACVGLLQDSDFLAWLRNRTTESVPPFRAAIWADAFGELTQMTGAEVPSDQMLAAIRPASGTHVVNDRSREVDVPEFPKVPAQPVHQPLREEQARAGAVVLGHAAGTEVWKTYFDITQTWQGGYGQRILQEIESQAIAYALREHPRPVDNRPTPVLRTPSVTESRGKAGLASFLIVIAGLLLYPILANAFGHIAGQIAGVIIEVAVVVSVLTLRSAAKKGVIRFAREQHRDPLPDPHAEARDQTAREFREAAVASAWRLDQDERTQTASRTKDQLQRIVQGRWEPLDNPPAPMTVCTFQQAERLAAQWLSFLGAAGCRVSQATRDGGMDVIADHFVAEVKHHQVPVTPVAVRALSGVATGVGKIPVFFSLSGYTSAAVEFAESPNIGMALFQYDYVHAKLHPRSKAARIAWGAGLLSLLETGGMGSVQQSTHP